MAVSTKAFGLLKGNSMYYRHSTFREKQITSIFRGRRSKKVAIRNRWLAGFTLLPQTRRQSYTETSVPIRTARLYHPTNRAHHEQTELVLRAPVCGDLREMFWSQEHQPREREGGWGVAGGEIVGGKNLKPNSQIPFLAAIINFQSD
jgi:hypothetical protein